VRSRLIATLLLAIAGACAQAQAPDWIEVDAERFTIRLPHGSTFSRTPGIDSFTGTLNAPGFAIHVDYGPHTDPLERDRSRTAHVERAVTVDGRPARLMRANSARVPSRYFIGLHVREVRRSAIGAIGLTLTCETDRAELATSVERAYLTVRFR
jgi:hypothetical protein